MLPSETKTESCQQAVPRSERRRSLGTVTVPANSSEPGALGAGRAPEAARASRDAASRATRRARAFEAATFDVFSEGGVFESDQLACIVVEMFTRAGDTHFSPRIVLFQRQPPFVAIQCGERIALGPPRHVPSSGRGFAETMMAATNYSRSDFRPAGVAAGQDQATQNY